MIIFMHEDGIQVSGFFLGYIIGKEINSIVSKSRNRTPLGIKKKKKIGSFQKHVTQVTVGTSCKVGKCGRI